MDICGEAPGQDMQSIGSSEQLQQSLDNMLHVHLVTTRLYVYTRAYICENRHLGPTQVH